MMMKQEGGIQLILIHALLFSFPHHIGKHLASFEEKKGRGHEVKSSVTGNSLDNARRRKKKVSGAHIIYGHVIDIYF